MIKMVFEKNISILMASLVFFLAGCSYNQYGFPGTISSKTMDTPCARITTLKAYGIHIYTKPSIGIHCGVIEREMVCPVLYKDKYHSGWAQWAISSGVSLKTDTNEIEYHDKPIQINTQRVGIGLDISAYFFSGILGLNHKRVIQAGSTDSFVFYYNNINPLMLDTCGVIAIENKGGENGKQGF